MLSSVYKHSFLGISYVILSLIIGENHPFSREPMYNSFPNLAIAFYLTDSTGHILPVKKYFGYNTDAITHNYHSIEETMGYPGNETKVILNQIGVKMWGQIRPHAYPSTITHGITLYRISYFLSKDTICQNDQILYQVP
jgi:hypothetical protein